MVHRLISVLTVIPENMFVVLGRTINFIFRNCGIYPTNLVALLVDFYHLPQMESICSLALLDHRFLCFESLESPEDHPN